MCSAVPFKGSIIGTRRRGSVPMSKTRESQLAVTTASGQRARHLPRNQARVPGGGSVTAAVASLGRDEPAQAQALVDRPLGPQVVVLQGQGGQPGVVASRSRGGPGRPAGAAAWPPSPGCRPGWPGPTRGPRGRTPSARGPARPTCAVVAQRAQAVLLGVLAGGAEELPLHLEGGGRGAVGQGERAGQGEVGRDLVQGPHRVGQGEVAGRAGVVLDHGQHDGGGAHLEEGGDLGQVGVARRSRAGGGSAWGRRGARRGC